MSGGFRASTIPNNVKKMIQNIKDITGNHSDEEIYTMLKDCSMDPNETAQKLLFQDPFHEVRSKRNKRKENQTNRDIVDSRRTSGPPGRGGRGGRGNYTSRYAAQDSSDGRKTAFGKENGINQASEKAGSISSLFVAKEAKSKDAESSVTVMANGPVSGTKQPEMASPRQSLTGPSKSSDMRPGVRDAHGESIVPATFSGVGTIKREVGSQLSPVEPISNISADHKSNATKMGGKSHGVGKNQAVEFSQPSSVTHEGSSSCRSSSNYGSRSQQSMGSQKVGPNKEWKPKPTNTNTVHRPKTPATSEGSIVSTEIGAHPQPAQSVTKSEEATNKLQKEVESLHVRDDQHVIIPNHIHVPEAVRTGLSFGSFDATFVIAPNRPSESEIQNSEPISETHRGTEVAVQEQAISQRTLAPTEETDYVDHSPSCEKPENLTPGDVSVPSSSIPDFGGSEETASGPQHSSVQTSTSYNFGFIPPMLGNPLGQLDTSETQAHDVSRVPSSVVQQPVDPSNFYAQFYRSGADSDGRVSPFPAPGIASKYNGNVAVLSSQSAPEGGNSLVLSSAAQTPTQAAGAMPSSITVTQQPMPLFRQPPGVHIPHYPPNYIPYGHYFSPFYVPPPAMHQFLGNNAFPHQAQAGSVYAGLPTAATSAAKFPLSQYKLGSNTGNSTHMGMSGSYGPYGPSVAGYNPGSAATAGNSTANEDLGPSQFKESNVYITGQQSEGSTVWIPAPGRDMSSLPANSFYNLPQGQHVTFAPTQAGPGPGPYAGIYHLAQGVTAANVHPLLQQSQALPGAVDMVGPTASGVYQQPQHAQMNWPNNY